MSSPSFLQFLLRDQTFRGQTARVVGTTAVLVVLVRAVHQRQVSTQKEKDLELEIALLKQKKEDVEKVYRLDK